MTLGTLEEIIRVHNIPDDCELLSDSGWECNATEVNGVYYNKLEKLIILTQGTDSWYERSEDWILLYSDESIEAELSRN